MNAMPMKPPMPMRAPLPLPAGLLPVRAQPQRIVAAVRGNSKEGKTTLSLDFPDPVVIFNFDYGYEAAARYILQKDPGKKLYHYDLPVSDETTPAEMAIILKKFQAIYASAVAYCDQERGTVVVDTASDLWRVVQEAILGPLKEAAEAKGKYMSQFEYGKANIVMAGILRKPLHYNNVNAVFVHRNRDIYDGANKTGRQEGQWFGDTPAIVEHIFEVYEDQADKKIKARIEVCRTDRTLRGTILTNPTYNLIWGMVGPPDDEEVETIQPSDGVFDVPNPPNDGEF
jgi:hypothetical protein